jgi:DNA primase
VALRNYDNQIVREIEDRLDILDIVAETVHLTRKGKRHWGLCPFHQEKTSSFSVSPDNKMFYCFGCHAGGDMFTFVMKRDGIDFREALDLLAKRAGIKLASNRPGEEDNQRARVLELNKVTADFYHKVLLDKSGDTARGYLTERGVTQETIKKFNIGFAPDNWNSLLNYLQKLGFKPEDMQLAGLIRHNDEKTRYFDAFRARIMFPIYYYNGDIVGFGGRVLGEALPKYLNTSETEIFSKRKNLFGLYQGKNAIRQENQLFLVEGYMDCIKMQQSGFENTVAALGTAFTMEQAKLIRRYAEQVIILFDADEAGQRETLRAIEILVKEGLNVYVSTLPGGKDPDECLELYGKEEFLKYIQNNKQSYIEFKILRYLDSEKKLDLEAKNRIISAVRNDIQHISGELIKDYYIKFLAHKLLLEEYIVRKELLRGNMRGNPVRIGNKSKILRDNIKYGNYTIGEKILATMLTDKELFGKLNDVLEEGWSSDPECNAMLKVYRENSVNQIIDADLAGRTARQQGLSSLFARLLFIIEEDLILSRQQIGEVVYKIQRRNAENKWRKAFGGLKKLNDEGDFKSLLNFILSLDSFINQAGEGGM